MSNCFNEALAHQNTKHALSYAVPGLAALSNTLSSVQRAKFQSNIKNGLGHNFCYPDYSMSNLNKDVSQDARKQGSENTGKDSARLPDRRIFLKHLGLDALTLLGAHQAYRRVFASESTTITPAAQDYPYIKQVERFKPRQTFLNLGVVHIGQEFEKDRKHIIAAIDESDTVMLEGCTGQGYFDFMAALAFEKNKEVIRLESDISAASGIGAGLNRLVMFATLLSNFNHYLGRVLLNPARKKQKTEAMAFNEQLEAHLGGVLPDKLLDSLKKHIPEISHPTLRRTGFTWSAVLYANVFGGTTGSLQKYENGQYPVKDWSHVLDGRTVLMLGEVEKYVAASPDKKTLVITGNFHAAGFAHYLQNENTRALYQRKLANYETWYKPWLGGSMEKEVDPAFKDNE